MKKKGLWVSMWVVPSVWVAEKIVENIGWNLGLIVCGVKMAAFTGFEGESYNDGLLHARNDWIWTP